ncbi:endosome-associated-trafficking regulator 1 isoform X1 [Ahaetulla prasina]|uniref:endosome-associated-trafficking regulator 1 isoform X1 n=1 Tax=Ahaetulla prasina TaxID=499056 RepID=UPI0026489F59|nr:endosome-associated-trafficking regulator 1 isoform X1 [Ahaetulla prasina]
MAGHSALPPGSVLGESVEPPWAGLSDGPPGNLGEGANPFSFKAFVRSQEQKAATASYVGTKNGSPEEPLRSCLLLDESSFLAESLGLNKDLRKPFFADPTASDSLLQDDEDDWSGSYQPSAVEEAHLARAPSASLSSSPIDSFYCNVSDLQTFSPEEPGRNDHVSCGCLGKGDQSSPSDQMSPEDGFCRLLQLHYQELKEENSKLRSTLSQIQAVSESQAERIRHLERTLEKSKRKEEKEARELEAMVQQVEENLQLMTKRAVKAESSAIKLKQENMHLQVQIESYKSENKALKSGHLENLTVVKQNADVALQNLLAVITRSKSSIKQLVSGAEELQLVADLLRSLDKISEMPSQGAP